jgi:general stress protein YciG
MTKAKRGTARLGFWKRREIASAGGKAVAPEQRTFSRQPEVAVAAAKKGGKSVRPEDRAFSRNPELAREAGRKGALALHAKRAALKAGS